MASKFQDTYSLNVQADTGDLDAIIDGLVDAARATDEVGTAASGAAGGVDRASGALRDLDAKADAARSGLGDIDGAADSAARGLDNAGEAAGETSGFLDKIKGSAGKAVGALLALTGVGAGLSIGAILGVGLADITALDSAMNKFQAQTGTRDWQMDGLQDTMEAIYTSNWGDSLDDVAASMATVRQTTQNWDTDFLEQMTTDALILRSVFDYDVGESVRASNQLIQQFGTEGGAAFDMITRAAQFSGDPAGDLLDTINEYSSTFADAGFTADEMMSILTSGVSGGAYNYDVVADSIREMNIRMQDGTSDLALWEMGLDGVKRQWKDGEVTSADFFEQVIAGLREMDDPLQRQQAGVALFGTKWEDMGDDMFLSLETTSDLFGDMEDATAKAGDAMSRGLRPAWDSFTRTVRIGIASALSPYVEKFVRALIPAFTKAGAWITETGIPALILFAGWIETGAGVVGQIVSALAGLLPSVDFIGGISSATGALAGFLGGLSVESLALIGTTLVAMAAPAVIGAVVAGLSAIVGLIMGAVSVAASPLLLVLGLVAAYETNFGGLKDAINDVRTAFEQGDIAGMIQGVANAMLAIPKGIATEIGDMVGIDVEGGLAAWGPALDNAGIIFGILKDRVAGALGNVRSQFTRLGNQAVEKLSNIVSTVTSFPGEVVSALSSFGSSLYTSLVQPFIDKALLISGMLRGGGLISLKNMITQIPVDVLTWLAGMAGGLFTALYEPFVSIIDTIWSKLTGAEPGALKGYLMSLPDKILGWLSELANTGTTLGQNFLDGIMGILSGFPNMLIKVINDAIPNELDFGSVSTPLGSISLGSIDIPDDPIPYLARGGTFSGLAVVGEEGPELAYAGSPTTILSNRRSRDLLAGAGAGGVNIYGEVKVYGVQNPEQFYEQMQVIARRRGDKK